MREGQASTTARRVAAHRLVFPRVPSDYGRPDADQALQADVAAGLEPPATPMTRYLRARTAFFDRVVVGAVDRAVEQLVVVGAGYDGRSLRYAKPGVRWFELDHPSTQEDKRARLERLDLSSPDLSFAAADFTRDDVALALGRAGHLAARPSAFLCEGVAGYLDLDVLRSLLASLAGIAAPGSLLAITVPLEPDSPDEQARRARLDEAVTRMGEPLASTVARERLGPFLAEAGWVVDRAVDPAGVDVAESSRSSAFVLARPS